MSLVVLRTFFHLGANVKCSALGQKRWWIHPPGSFACFKETLRMRDIGKGGGSDVWEQKPHVEWEAAKWSLCSSSSGPVVLKGWLLQANAKNCKPGNTSVQLCSPSAVKHTNPLSKSNHVSGGQRESERNTTQDLTETERSWGYVWLLTPNTKTKTFSAPRGWPHWAKTKSSPLKVPMECKANLPVILPLQSFFLSLSSCTARAVCLYLFSWGHN